jgi:transcriptional activator of cad operon
MTNNHTQSETKLEPFTIGDWQVDPQTNRITKDGQPFSLEPKVMDLLVLLASNPGRVFSHNEINSALWSDVTVGEDTLARTISRLRRALGDSAQAPKYVETIPKRGYRIVVEVVKLTAKQKRPQIQFPTRRVATVLALILISSIWVFFLQKGPQLEPPSQADILTSRADDLYMRFTRADNEAAIALYERVLAADKNYASAQAGLANALVQRVVRWPHKPGSEASGASTLAEALEQGLTQKASAQQILTRAVAMAERAVRLAPQNPDALKALGFTYTARGDLDRGEAIYKQAIAIDENAWESLINLGEIYNIKGDHKRAVQSFELAFDAMDRTYAHEPQRVGPWQSALGVVIGEIYEQLNAPLEAELWYRRVLDQVPLEPEATLRLAKLMRRLGDEAEATRLCNTLQEKVGMFDGCQQDGDQ